MANMQRNPLMCSQPEELQRLKNKQRKNKNKWDQASSEVTLGNRLSQAKSRKNAC